LEKIADQSYEKWLDDTHYPHVVFEFRGHAAQIVLQVEQL